MTLRLKVGDRVRFLDIATNYDLMTYPEHRPGHVATVTGFFRPEQAEQGVGGIILDHKDATWYASYRFELVKPEPVVRPDEWMTFRAHYLSPDPGTGTTNTVKQAAVLFLLLHLARHVRWTLERPDEMVTITVPRSAAEKYAAVSDLAVGMAADLRDACREALDLE